MNTDTGAVKSADRVLSLLELLGEPGAEMSHADLAVALGIPKSSLTHLLKTLLARGWLTVSPRAKAYALGPAVLALSQRAAQGARLVEAAREVLARLTSITGETSALNLRQGDETEVAATALSAQRLLSVMREGDRAPLYATSGGKVILAHAAPSWREGYLARASLVPITAATLDTAERLKAALEEARTKGYALSREEFTPGVVGIACPLLEATGRVLGAINVAMPASRYTPRTDAATVPHLRRAAAELARGGAWERDG